MCIPGAISVWAENMPSIDILPNGTSLNLPLTFYPVCMLHMKRSILNGKSGTTCLTLSELTSVRSTAANDYVMNCQHDIINDIVWISKPLVYQLVKVYAVKLNLKIKYKKENVRHMEILSNFWASRIGVIKISVKSLKL